jgi:hypothetical protein
MPPTSHVVVAADEVPGVVDALLTTCAVAADAVHHALAGYLDGTVGETELRDHRRRLGECEDALERIGWARGPRLDGGELAGPASLVGEVLTTSLLAAAEAVAAACRRYDTGRAELADIEAAIADLTARQRLFAAHEREAGD